MPKRKAQTAVPAVPKASLGTRIKKDIIKNYQLYLLMIPGFLLLILFKIGPVGAMVIAFEDFSAAKGVFGSTWVGLENFKRILQDPYIWKITKNTIVLAFLSVVVVFPIPIIFSLFLNEVRTKWVRNTVQSLSFLPYFISAAVMVSIMYTLLSPTSGLINILITKLGGTSTNFMAKPEWFRPLYVILEIWQTFGYSAINAMEVREDDEEFENPVDLMFKELESRQPGHFAVRQYKKYKLAAGKTAKSILISAAARTSIFDIQEVRDLTAYDELELDTLGDRKTALFLIMSDTEDSMNFLIAMAYSQLFNLLCEKADDVYGGRLPVHVRCLIDEAANIGQIPRLEKLVATIRSREVSACLVLQAQSQLKAIYKDNADTIIGNMDATVFLGGKEPTTLKELAASLGKETIDTYNTGESRGRETSHSLNYQKLGKDMP